jgi:hypothetical protein
MAAAYDALHRINVELQERKWADEITKFRNAPVKAGIDAAFEELVRMFSGVQPFHTAEPEPSTPKAQPTDATPR